MENKKKIEKVNATDIPLGKLVSIITRSQGIYLNRNLSDLNIRGFQIYLLLEIYNKKDSSQSDIAAQYKIDKGAVSRAIQKLEKEELISREIDETNRRRNIISLTEKGNKTISEIIKTFDKWEEEIYKEIDLIEKDILHEVLKRVALNSIAMNEVQ